MLQSQSVFIAQSFGGEKVKGRVESISPNQVKDNPKSKIHQLLYYFPTKEQGVSFMAS